MNKLVAGSIAIALFLLAGCAASGPKLASSAEDIPGTWKNNINSWEIQFYEDGTWRRELVDDHAHDGAEFRFEGTRLILKTEQGGPCPRGFAETGIYEVELLENGSLMFTVIEDECAERVAFFTGALAEGILIIEAEWEPVP